MEKPVQKSLGSPMEKADAVLTIAEHDYALMTVEEKLRVVKWSWHLYKRKGVTVSESLKYLLENNTPHSLRYYDPRYKELILTNLTNRYMAHSNESISKRYYDITNKNKDITCKQDKMHRINSLSSLIVSMFSSYIIAILIYIFIQQTTIAESFRLSRNTIENAQHQMLLDIWFTLQLTVFALAFIPAMVFYWILVYKVTVHKGFYNPYYKSMVLVLILLFGYLVCYVVGSHDSRIIHQAYF